ncbi:hypothetical protein BGW38_006190, partial [Lunasporangiospora selenospora]
ASEIVQHELQSSQSSSQSQSHTAQQKRPQLLSPPEEKRQWGESDVQESTAEERIDQ